MKMLLQLLKAVNVFQVFTTLQPFTLQENVKNAILTVVHAQNQENAHLVLIQMQVLITHQDAFVLKASQIKLHYPSKDLVKDVILPAIVVEKTLNVYHAFQKMLRKLMIF
jgi:hypothetical protein